MKEINCSQGSDEWLAYRKLHIGSSDSGAILESNPFRSRLEVWRDKCGLSKVAIINSQMAMGNKYESIARTWHEELKGESLQPLVCEHDTIHYLSASFDGISVDRKRAVEIKCGAKSFLQAKDGHIPRYYWHQCQHLYLVGGVDLVEYLAFDPTQKERPIIIPIEIDLKEHAFMKEEYEVFWDYIVNFIHPEPINRNYEVVHENDRE